MPYPEYRSWEIFYLIEPFGFSQDEYRTAVNLAMQYNINRGKNKARDAKDFMRDIPSLILAEIKEKPTVEALSRDEIIKQIKKDFGI